MIVIARGHLRRIVDAAEQAYPAECCGLLVGRAARRAVTVTEVHPSVNLAAPARDRFEIDPRLRLELQRRLRGGGERVVGLYHSHPDGSAQPSANDLDSAWEPELVWLVTAVEGGQAIHTTAHRLAADGTRFRPMSLRTGDWCRYPRRTPITWSGLP